MNKIKQIWQAATIFLLLIFSACNTDFTPRPKGYPRIHFPERVGMELFSSPVCPFTFEVPNYYLAEIRTSFMDTIPADPCWLNLEVPALNGTIYLSYKDVDKNTSLTKLVEDAYKLTYKHSQKADFIEPVEIHTDQNVYGLIYYVGGDAASPIQFFVTDTVSHFLRGAVYFMSRPNADSIAPVVEFMQEDIEYLLGTLVWE